MAQNVSPEQELRDSLDNRIKELEGQIRILKEQRNTLAPITRLPADLLFDIFLFVRDKSSGTAQILPPASHVCRAWREIALGSPMLWTTIDCQRMQWAEVQLKRSSTTPVHVSVNKSGGIRTTGAAVQFAVSALPRAGMFYFDYDSPLLGTHNVTLQDWPSDAPLLERFHIHSPMVWRLPAEFMGGAFPKLKVVDLKNCLFNWEPSGFFSGLTELRISLSESWTESWNLRLHDILRTLQDMNDLKILELSMDSTSENGERAAIQASDLFHVRLPSLSVLELGLHASTTIALLDHLPHPRERLKVSCNLNHEQNALVLLRHLEAFRSHMVQLGYTMDAAFLRGYQARWELCICDPARVRDPTKYTGQWHLQAFLSLSNIARQVCPAIWSALLSPSNCFTFTELDVYKSVREYLSHCTALCVGSYNAHCSYELLSREMFVQPNDVSWLPALRALVVHSANFSRIPKTSKLESRVTSAKYRRRLQNTTPFIPQVKFLNCLPFLNRLLGLPEDVRYHISHTGAPLTEYQVMKLAFGEA